MEQRIREWLGYNDAKVTEFKTALREFYKEGRPTNIWIWGDGNNGKTTFLQCLSTAGSWKLGSSLPRSLIYIHNGNMITVSSEKPTLTIKPEWLAVSEYRVGPGGYMFHFDQHFPDSDFITPDDVHEWIGSL